MNSDWTYLTKRVSKAPYFASNRHKRSASGRIESHLFLWKIKVIKHQMGGNGTTKVASV
jgi:hypothetical protein